jgi:uncharacterized membrane protein YkvA (DUF1232 family)
MERVMSDNSFESQYTDQGFWEKAKTYAKSAGLDVMEAALKLYYSAIDKDTPTWAKTSIYAALGYFIAPLDAIADFVPVVGYSDDLGVLVAAAAAVVAHIKPEHQARAKKMIAQWFGESYPVKEG